MRTAISAIASRIKGGYFPVPPVDSRRTCAPKCWPSMADMGVAVEKHHHEVASAQHELGFKFDTADQVRRPSCRSTNTSSTTSPTPTARRRPSCPSRSRATTARACMCHQSIWKDGKPLFAGDGYADLVGNLPVLHRRHHQARQGAQRLHQPARPTATSAWSPASRRRCCWPIRRATARRPAASPMWPARRASASRSASPIPAPTPISPSAAMLMAGLDGIANKIHPGDADGQGPL